MFANDCTLMNTSLQN